MPTREATPVGARLYCLTCRTRVTEGSRCTLDPMMPSAVFRGGKMTAVHRHLLCDLSNDEGRDRWTRYTNTRATRGLMLPLSLALVALTGGWVFLAFLHDVCLFGVVAVALFVLFGGLALIRRLNRTTLPMGMPTVGLPPIGESLRGVVQPRSVPGEQDAQSEPVAVRVELLHHKAVRGPLMLQEARSRGFDVRLDDGQVVQVPAGRMRLLGGDRRRHSLDRQRARETVFDTFGSGCASVRYSAVAEVGLRPGDRVALYNEAMAKVVAGASYREAPRVLVLEGMPVVELLA